MKINQFVISFEQNMQVLLSMTNLFEQKTIFEIEKQKNNIIDLLSSESIDVNTKLTMISKKLEELTSLVRNTFLSMKTKIKDYEDISNKKIGRSRNAFLLNLKKFLK